MHGADNGPGRVRVSLVVCTRNRANYLPEMLTSIGRLKMSTALWELIVVNNASTDETRNVLADFATSFRGSVRVIEESRPGLSIARNTGWRLARGDYVAFTDDDCYPAENFLDMVVLSFGEHKQDYMGGRVLLHDPLDAPVTIQLREDTVFISPSSYVEAGLIHGANLCAKRSLLETLNGFDELLGAGAALRSGEDTDLMMRASDLGYAGVYDPRAVVAHHHRRRAPAELASLFRGYAYGRGALAAKAIVNLQNSRTYTKWFYWRCRSFIRDGQWSELSYELKGFADYFIARLFKTTFFN